MCRVWCVFAKELGVLVSNRVREPLGRLSIRLQSLPKERCLRNSFYNPIYSPPLQISDWNVKLDNQPSEWHLTRPRYPYVITHARGRNTLAEAQMAETYPALLGVLYAGRIYQISQAKLVVDVLVVYVFLNCAPLLLCKYKMARPI